MTHAVLFFWISFFVLTQVFVLQWLSLHQEIHVVVSVSIDLPMNSKQDSWFHRIAYDYFCVDWDGLHEYL